MHNMVSYCVQVEQKLCAALRIKMCVFHIWGSAKFYTQLLSVFTQFYSALNAQLYPQQKALFTYVFNNF